MPALTGPRFTVRWTNGYWRVFDRVSFSDAAIEFRKKDADMHAAKLNGGR